MTTTGGFAIQPLYLYDATGAPVSYATKAAMQAALWDLTWYDSSGVALASQPTWTLPVAGALGRHQIRYVIPASVWTCKVTLPSALHISAPTEFPGEGLTYDTNTIGALIATSSGVTLSPSTVSATATIYQGDSLVFDFSISESALTLLGVGVGAGALALVDTLLCQIKLNTADSGDVALVAVFTNTITSDVVGTRTVRAVLNAFPSGLNIPAGAKSLPFTAHLRLTEGSVTFIASVIAGTVLWKATTA